MSSGPASPSSAAARRFGRQHAGLHRIVAALDARQVHEAGGAADQRAAGKATACGTDWIAAFGDGARAIADALAALQHLRDGGMGLGALEFAERIEPGIVVVEMNDKTDGAEILAPVIQEQAAAGVVVQRPAHAVQHQTLFVLAGRQLPQFLQADAEFLRLAPFMQAELRAQAVLTASRARLPRTRCICRAAPCPACNCPCDGRPWPRPDRR